MMQTQTPTKRMQMTIGLVALLLAALAVPQGAATDEPIHPFDDLVCIGDGLPGTDGCYGGSEYCQGIEFEVGGIEVGTNCETSGAKCRWYNAWEADVTWDADETAYGELLEGEIPTDEWEVIGFVACGDSGDHEECSVNEVVAACNTGAIVAGKGEVTCDLSIVITPPSAIGVIITCKDPIVPCFALQTFYKAGEYTRDVPRLLC